VIRIAVKPKVGIFLQIPTSFFLVLAAAGAMKRKIFSARLKHQRPVASSQR
jgi:hypothetical protein